MDDELQIVTNLERNLQESIEKLQDETSANPKKVDDIPRSKSLKLLDDISELEVMLHHVDQLIDDEKTRVSYEKTSLEFQAIISMKEYKNCKTPLMKWFDEIYHQSKESKMKFSNIKSHLEKIDVNHSKYFLHFSVSCKYLHVVKFVENYNKDTNDYSVTCDVSPYCDDLAGFDGKFLLNGNTFNDFFETFITEDLF